MPDPAFKLEPEEEIRVTSYLVHQGSWQSMADHKSVGYSTEAVSE
jgi:hypothetical protein